MAGRLYRFREVFRLDPTINPIQRNKVEQTLAVLDSLHYCKKISGWEIPVIIANFSSHADPYTILDAHAYYTWRESVPKIVLSERSRFIETDFIHESAHYLDHLCLHHRHQFVSSKAHEIPLLHKWHQAVQQSDLKHELEARRTASQSEVRFYLDYVLSPAELWACSYTQYIIRECNSGELMRQLNLLRLSETPRYWSDSDFDPIYQAISGLLEELQWRIPS